MSKRLPAQKRKERRGEPLNKKSVSKTFEDVFQESVEEAFSSLGEAVKKSIYYHLELNFRIRKKDIPCRVDDFADALEKIFGVGAQHIELLIMKKLNEKISCSYKWDGPSWLVPDLTFQKYVRLLRISCEDNIVPETVEVIVDAGQKQEQHR